MFSPVAILRLGCSCLITSPSGSGGWASGLSLWAWDLLRVHTAGQGCITKRGGLSDLLLALRPVNSRTQPWGWLSWWDHHSLQQLFDGVDSLIGLLYHSFQLSLSTCCLGEIDFGMFNCLLFSRPLSRIWGLSLVLTLWRLVLG